jgi:hypothetical protein
VLWVDDVSGSINHPTLDGVGCSCFDLSAAPSYFGSSSGSTDTGSAGPAQTGSESTLNNIQMGLTFFGMVPVVGDAANLVNAGISLFRGNYGEAAVNAIAALPLVGVIGEAAIAAKEVEAGLEAAELASQTSRAMTADQQA